MRCTETFDHPVLYTVPFVGRGSSVGTEIHFGLDGLWIESRWRGARFGRNAISGAPSIGGTSRFAKPLIVIGVTIKKFVANA